MDSYVIFKHLHMTAVVLSGLLFMVRGLWLLQGSTQLQAKWVKITPHVIDTLLLFSAIAMLVVAQQFPVWVHVKITLLVVYIGLGVMAFKKAKTQGQKLTFLLAAVAVYVFLISVALAKSPAGFFA
ncbi:MAG: SirB2 family protein [Moraxellaceae bacterium]|nr:SirB2 family protein [Moraxellaceae bacterium]MCP5176347.1 SirB2 family protein [Moraxellaceae bacterium]